MQKRKRQSPTYRQRKGYDQAIVTLTDSVTGYRKDYWLGPYGSPESRELYHRVLAQWESGGRRLPVTLDDKPADITQVSISEVLNAYWKWASRHYGHSELGCLRVVIRLLRTMFGSTPAADFGPNRLRLLSFGRDRASSFASPWIASFMSRPTLNLTVFLAGTGTRSSVLGFWAIRGARCLISKTPKSRNSRRLPRASSRMTLFRKLCTVLLTAVRSCPVSTAMRSIKSFFVVVIANVVGEGKQLD